MHDTTLIRLRSDSIFTSIENLRASRLISRDMDLSMGTTHAAMAFQASPSNPNAEP